jgi:hypothetical protein
MRIDLKLDIDHLLFVVDFVSGSALQRLHWWFDKKIGLPSSQPAVIKDCVSSGQEVPVKISVPRLR